jgi:glycogen synthase
MNRSNAQLDCTERTVTVVIPCYNHGRFIRRAVRSALKQKDVVVHVVVVNDGSTDGTSAQACQACSGPRVTVIQQKNAGLPAARNRGADPSASRSTAARPSTYLAFLDADDWLLPGALDALCQAIEERRQAGTDTSISHAYGQQQMAELGKGVWHVAAWDPVTLMVTNTQPVTCLVRRDRFELVGGFDETMTDGYEDWDLWLRFASRGLEGVRVRRPTHVWRRHSTDTMVSRAIAQHEKLYARLIENHAQLFDRLGDQAAVKANAMLRQFDANWIDETGYPIEHQVLYARRESYERMTAVRMHHALQRGIDRLPLPAATMARGVLNALRPLAPAPRRRL